MYKSKELKFTYKSVRIAPREKLKYHAMHPNAIKDIVTLTPVQCQGNDTRPNVFLNL